MNIPFKRASQYQRFVAGFIAGHILEHLFQSNKYTVRATVRGSPDARKYKYLHDVAARYNSELQLFQANLEHAKGWDEAAASCTFVIHTATPVPTKALKDPNELLEPALKGIRFVFEASARAGIRRMVLTSSTSAVILSDVLLFSQRTKTRNQLFLNIQRIRNH